MKAESGALPHQTNHEEGPSVKTPSLGRLAALLVACALAAPLATAPSAARAATGDYTQILCANPVSGQGLGIAGMPDGLSNPTNDVRWQVSSSYADCGAGAMGAGRGVPLTVGHGANYGSGTWAELEYTTPPNVTIVGGHYYRTEFAGGTSNGFITINQHAGVSGNFQGLPRHPSDQGGWYDGNITSRGNIALGWINPANRIEPVHTATSWRVAAACDPAGNNGNMCTLASGQWEYRLYGGAMTLRDASDPTATSVAGGLATAATLRGAQELTFSATDVGAGLYRARLLVDGVERDIRVIDPNAGHCADVNLGNTDPYEFAYQVPCKLSAAKTISYDTLGWPEGEHNVKAQIEDAGGNVTTIVNRLATVDNVLPPASSSPPAITGTPEVGALLTADRGAWSGAGIAYAYRWQRSADDGATWVDIPAATAATHELTASDEGKLVKVRVTATNAEGSAVAFSEAGQRIAPRAAAAGQRGGESPSAPAPPLPATNGSHASHGARITTRYASRRHAVRLPYGRRIAIRGTLADERGRPIGGARLRVLTQTAAPGAPVLDRGALETRADGTFTYITPVGPSRLIRFVYRSNTANEHVTDSTEVELVVAAGATLRAGPGAVKNGRATTFSGRLLGGPLPAKGKLVLLQARYHGAWRTFASVRTDSAGRFSYRYRFVATYRPTSYGFRAVVRAESGYPYAAGRSRAVRVSVRP